MPKVMSTPSQLITSSIKCFHSLSPVNDTMKLMVDSCMLARNKNEKKNKKPFLGLKAVLSRIHAGYYIKSNENKSFLSTVIESFF